MKIINKHSNNKHFDDVVKKGHNLFKGRVMGKWAVEDLGVGGL